MTYSVIGVDKDTNKRVEISQSSRRQGLYILGANGTGKTGLILQLVIQDIVQGLGVCVLDPHGDLTRDIIARVPSQREKDVVLLDLEDVATFPFGLNLFACSDVNDPHQVQYTVDRILHVFEKIFGVTRDTPLLSQYLRNLTYTIVYNHYTMAEAPLLLVDEAFRKQLVQNVPNRYVREFWNMYEQLRPGEKIEQSSSILRRFEDFLQPLTEPIVGQVKTTINTREMMDARKILLVKLDNRLEAVTSLIGSVIVAIILNAAYSRSNLPPEKRKQFNLYADEFQRFATDDFATLLTEARKFGIATTIAHQIRDQLDGANKGASLNVANLVVFKISGKDADELAGEYNCSPPLPLLDKREKVLTIAEDVVGHLFSLQGYSSPVVSSFFGKCLRALDKRAKMERTTSKVYNHNSHEYDTIYDPPLEEKEEIRSLLYDQLNPFFYAVMKEKNPYKPIPLGIILGLGEFLGFPTMTEPVFMEALGREKRFDATLLTKIKEQLLKSWEKVADLFSTNVPYGFLNPTREYPYEVRHKFSTPLEENVSPLQYIAEKVVEQFNEKEHIDKYWKWGFIVKFKYPTWSNPPYTTLRACMDYLRKRYRNWDYKYSPELDTCFAILNYLRTFLEHIAKEPIMVDSGRWEMKPGTQRTYADMQNEIASTLANLPRYHARVKVEDGEHTIRTLAPERGISRKELEERIARIQAQNRSDGYTRARADVEVEIAKRQQFNSASPSAQPQQRFVRQIPLAKN